MDTIARHQWIGVGVAVVLWTVFVVSVTLILSMATRATALVGDLLAASMIGGVLWLGVCEGAERRRNSAWWQADEEQRRQDRAER